MRVLQLVRVSEMPSLNINISDKAEAFAAHEAEKRGLANAAAFAATLLEETAGKNGHLEPSTAFHDAKTNLDELIRSQGVQPIQNLHELEADFWPTDESADDFIRGVRQQSGPDNSGRSHR